MLILEVLSIDIARVPCMFSSLHSRPYSTRKRMISKTYTKSNIQSSAALAAQAHAGLYGRLLPPLILCLRIPKMLKATTSMTYGMQRLWMARLRTYLVSKMEPTSYKIKLLVATGLAFIKVAQATPSSSRNFLDFTVSVRRLVLIGFLNG